MQTFGRRAMPSPHRRLSPAHGHFTVAAIYWQYTDAAHGLPRRYGE
jgi:hypothetical protein